MAKRAHDPAKRRGVKQAIERPPVRLAGTQANAVVNGFDQCLRKHAIRCFACAILPDHAHFVLDRVDRSIERVAIGLKAYATRALLAAGAHPFQPHADRGRIGYVDRNPTNAGLQRQRWSFVEPFAPVFA